MSNATSRAVAMLTEFQHSVLPAPTRRRPGRLPHYNEASGTREDITAQSVGGIMAASESEWEEMTATKLSAMRRFCRAVIPHMRQRHWGRIVSISSIGGIHPNYRLMVSHALSAAINNLTRSIALEVARDGILVNAIAAGAVLTDN